MASVAIDNWSEHSAAASDQRTAPRFTSLIRAAKLICEQGEFVCIVRDVSTAGVRLRCFHTVPRDPALKLELENGDRFPIEWVRGEGNEASFRFPCDVPIERLVPQATNYPRRQLRLNIAIPLTLRTLMGPVAAITRNLSQQGCKVESAMPLALAQPVVVEGAHLPGIRAKVRWRHGAACGLVFDDTFSLIDFATHAARLQAPALALG
jgi:hypothetical protein